MKKIFKITGLAALLCMFATSSYAEDKKVEQPKVESSKPTEVVTIGLPLNNSGISVVGKPDKLVFVTIDSDSKININWENVCKISKAHEFNLEDLKKVNIPFESFIIPYIIKASNTEHKC